MLTLMLSVVCAPPPLALTHTCARQAHYERLALGVAAYVQALLLTRCGLKRRLVRGVDVYVTPDADTAPGLLVRPTVFAVPCRCRKACFIALALFGANAR